MTVDGDQWPVDGVKHEGAPTCKYAVKLLLLRATTDDSLHSRRSASNQPRSPLEETWARTQQRITTSTHEGMSLDYVGEVCCVLLWQVRAGVHGVAALESTS